MKINFTKKEYQYLVEMLQVADLVMRGYEAEPEEEMQGYRDLRKKVLSYHKEAGLTAHARYAPERDEDYDAAAYEGRASHFRFIEAYEEATFWALLTAKLARRDLDAKEAVSADAPFDEETREREYFALIDRYGEEFAAHGLENLRVVGETRSLH